MLKSIKTSFKDTIIYGLGNVAVKIVGLLLIPIYTNQKFFSIDDFAIIGLVEITGLILTSVMASALPQSLTRWYWDKNHRSNQKGIFFMSISAQLVISIAFCVVLIPFSRPLSLWILKSADWHKVMTLLIISSSLQAINNLINTLMRLQSKSVLYSITNLLKLISVLSLTLFFILSKKMGIEGIYLAQVIGYAFILLFLLGYTARNSRLFFDFTLLKEMNIYGFPLLIANFSAALLGVIDRYSLSSITVLKSVALYTMAVKVTSVLKLVLVDSIKLAVGPMMIKRMDSPNNKRFYSKVLLYSSYITMIGIVAVSLFSYEIIKVLAGSREFWGAVVVIPLLSLSIFFVNMKEVTVYGLHIAKKTRIIGFIVVFTTIISLLLNILFIPLWDITGAAFATLLSQFIYWFLCYYFSQKVFYVPYEIKKILTMLVTGAVLSFSSLLINGMDLLPRMIIKTACLLSFPFILYLFNFYEPIELQTIKGFFNKWSKIRNFKANLQSLRGMTDSEF